MAFELWRTWFVELRFFRQKNGVLNSKAAEFNVDDVHACVCEYLFYYCFDENLSLALSLFLFCCIMCLNVLLLYQLAGFGWVMTFRVEIVMLEPKILLMDTHF